jgi:hypothetical protein
MNGFTLYDGPSTIDGAPIVAVVTGLGRPSSNVKTGPMVQVFIIRSDVHPMEAAHTGDDVSICGSCRHRGRIETDPVTGKRSNKDRSCYVTLIRSPRMVYEAYRRGQYPPLTPEQASTALRGRKVRLGAYGDPGAIPLPVLTTALSRVREMTGYTHLWQSRPKLSEFCMASCDTPAERDAASALGFRTFRVRTKDEPLLPGEGHCPASNEMGHAVQCVGCMLCGGQRTKARADITLLVHGTGSKHFTHANA